MYPFVSIAYAQSAGDAGSQSPFFQFIPLVLILGVFWFLIIPFVWLRLSLRFYYACGGASNDICLCVWMTSILATQSDLKVKKISWPSID